MGRSVAAAALCAASIVPAAAFVAGPVAGAAAPPPLRSSAGAAGRVPEQRQGSFGAGAIAVCGLGAAAVALSRRRSAVPRGVGFEAEKPRLLFNVTVEEKTPVPGSYKALQAMIGADVETGSTPWDPLGFSKLYDRNFDFNMVMTYPHVQWLRESEIKHGRAAMLAVVGIIVQQAVRIGAPYPNEPDWTKVVDECTDKYALVGLLQIFVFTMLTEGKFYAGDAWIGQLDREPGDLGFDPLKLSKKGDLKSLQLKELKNGRAAMIGFAAFLTNHFVPGSNPLITGLYAQRPQAPTAGAQGRLCGATRPAAKSSGSMQSKTAARYTTQTILPALTWLKTGVKASDLAPTELKAKQIGGVDVLIGKDESGKIFCVGNLCPHIGTPMSEGADVIGDVIVCPLHGSSFKVTTGELIDWCPSPPIIGPITGFLIEKKNLLVVDIRQGGLFGSGELEVLVDTNAKKAYEANYWKGVLDAQGKNDGTFY